MVRIGCGVIIVGKGKGGAHGGDGERGNQSNIWERRTEVDRDGFIKREGTKEGLERKRVSVELRG
jgi:hypothetical protein